MPIPGSTAGRRRCAVAVASALVCSTGVTGPVLAPAAASSPPAPRLDWHPCPHAERFDCATAKVPLDYRDPGRRTLELAVVRRRATGPGRRIGTLFFNPGGPGGPGTVQMPQSYAFFPRQVRERFDIVSWDPRGIGNSTAVRCFDTAEEAAAWQARLPAGFPVGERQRAAWNAAYEELGRRCERRDPELLRHVSTADTARDLDQLRRAVGDPQLTYLGISYGSYLGATYASLFPGRVRAMTLDGAIDPSASADPGSHGRPRLPTFLRTGSDRGAAATLDRFLALCGATTADCAFSAGSPQATRDKYHQLTRRLREHPQGTWTYARTVADVIGSLYSARPGWTLLAGRLQELWQGQVPQKPAPPPPPVPLPYLGLEQAAAVLCSDSPNPRDLGAYPTIEENAARRAGDAGRFWTWATEPCATWPATAADRYTGPWNHRTAHPLLVVNPTYDPATSYRAAETLAGALAGARLLTLDGYGHTALLNPSGCVGAHESRYLIDGVLPPAGARCAQDALPFSAPKPVGGIATGGGGRRR